MNLLFIKMFGIRKIIKYYLHSDIKIYFFSHKRHGSKIIKKYSKLIKGILFSNKSYYMIHYESFI